MDCHIKGEKKEALLTLRQKLEHQSDTKVIHNDDGNSSRANIKQALGRDVLISNERNMMEYDGISNTHVLERFNPTARNHVKKILLKLNLSDHRSILKDSKRQSVKVKELQERCIINAFKLSYQEKYEHVGPKSQDHKMARLQDNVKRLCLVDDLKKFRSTFISSERYKSKA
ncbi:hypothetical protein Tco_0267404 [Tanacetum coccineum]